MFLQSRFALLILVLFVPCAAQAGQGDELSGPNALALVAALAPHSTLSPADKKLVRMLYDGKLQGAPEDRGISVHAELLSCRSSDLDISLHECTLDFGDGAVKLRGRAAYEILLIEKTTLNGTEDGATVMHKLSCTVNPAQLAKRDGSGAECVYY